MTAAGPPEAGPSRSRWRTLAYSALLLLLLLGVVELGAYAGLRLLFGGLDIGSLAAAREPAADQPGPPSPRAGVGLDEALHPYLGYLKQDAFHDLFAALQAPKPADEVWVLVVGGSVAAGLHRWDQLGSAFEAELAAGGPDDRRLRLFKGARGGFKQPQQLLLIGYLLALGAPVDIVINVDGFNDVVLPWWDNGRLGVNPSYPRSWAERLAIRSGGLDPLVVAEVARLRERQRTLAALVVDSPWGGLASARLFATLGYSDAEGRILALQERLHNEPDELSLEQRGSEIKDWEEGPVLVESARLWARSSRLLADLLARQGVEYFHFLQPNQYLAGSKPLSVEERTHFYRPEGAYGRYARLGYPLLQQAAAEHGLASPPYFDATQLYAAEPATLYQDACCHLNSLGNRMLAEFVARQTIAHSRRLALSGNEQ